MADILPAFIAGFWEVLLWETFVLLLLGLAIGFFVGLLPGMGGPAALALMLPFTFAMEPAGAFAFLLGMITVTGTTGDITSILFGIPGEAHTAATIVDGHPMAKNGEAGRAIGAALMSSLLGAWVGAFALALAIPIFRPVVLAIGYGEFFMLTLVGVTLVAALSGPSMMKGIAAAGTGFLLSMVGLDAIAGIQRYTFGQVFLWDGLGLVVITLGIFAIPEVIELAVKGTSIAGGHRQADKFGGVMEGIKDTFRHWALTLRCSILGMVLALIPGMGASVCQWIAYAHAVQSSPNRERFGKGAVEGVLGPGAANNSALGGHLITTVAFGIPGGVVMAILLGAFIIQGIVPGPSMLIPERDGGHLTLTFSFVWTIVLANVIAVAAVLVFLKPLVNVTHLRAGILIPFVLLLIYVGAFAEKNSFPALAILLLVGALGWVMVQLNWPRPPLILGVVLGPLMETNLFLAIGSHGAAWLLRPGVLFFFAVGLTILFLPLLKARRRQPRQLQNMSVSAVEAEAPQVNLWWPILFDIFLILLFAWALRESWDWPWRTRLFPWTIGWPVLAVIVTQLVRDLWKLQGQKVEVRAIQTTVPIQATSIGRRRMIGIWASFFGFLLVIWLVGFYIAVPITMLLYLKLAGHEKWPISLAIAAAAWLIFSWTFNCSLHVPFPQGLLVTLLEEVTGVGLMEALHTPLVC